MEPGEEGSKNPRIGEAIERPAAFTRLLPLRLVVLDSDRGLERELEPLVLGTRWLDVDSRGLLGEDA